MRILEVRLKNLNSLVGEWILDFSDPAYSSEGIFAIIGPTGSGKTTILDAICLALYGRTPRLNKISKSANEIMSRQTGECYAEVLFTTQAGCFRCHWSQHRARNKADGELQAPRHEIADASSGQVLESKLRDVAEYIERVTGMNFDQFTRSMLLAQGGFAAFLQAPPDERAPILEQITGSDIYSQISIKIHERRAEERNKLSRLEAELAGIKLLSEAEELSLHAALAEKQGLAQELAQQSELLRKALGWLENIKVLEHDLLALDVQWQAFTERQQAFAADWQRWERAHKALALEGYHARVAALRELQNQEIAELAALNQALPVREVALEQIVQANVTALQAHNEMQALQMKEAGIIKRVRELDLRLSNKQSQLETSEKAIKALATGQAQYLHNIRQNADSIQQSQTILLDLENYLSEHSIDAGLVNNLSALAKMFESLHRSYLRQIQTSEAYEAASARLDLSVLACLDKETSHEQALLAWEQVERSYRQMEQEIAALLAGNNLSERRRELDILQERKRLLAQSERMLEQITAGYQKLGQLETRHELLNSEQVHLEQDMRTCLEKKAACERGITSLEREVALLNRIRDLEAERARLEKGQPCPLCGASEHPYTHGNIPVMDEAEARLKEAKDEMKHISLGLTALQVKQAETIKDLKQTQRETKEQQTSLELLEKQCGQALISLHIKTLDDEALTLVHRELSDVELKLYATHTTIQQVEQKEIEQNTTRKALDQARITFSDADRALQLARHERETSQGNFERLALECTGLEQQYNMAYSQILGDVAIYGIEELPVLQLEPLLDQLRLRRNRWQSKVAEKLDCERLLAALIAAQEKEQLLLHKLDEELLVRRMEQAELLTQAGLLKQERMDLYGNKDPDGEESRLADQVKQLSQVLEITRTEHGQAEQEVAGLRSRMASLEDSIEKRLKELAPAQQELSRRLTRAGFTGEIDYLNACLPETERNRIALQAETLQRAQTELETRRQDKILALETERQRMMTEQSAETLRQDLTLSDTKVKELQQEMGAFSQQLNDNEKQRVKQQDRLIFIAAQKNESQRWDALHELIGSADGKKYRNFAQGLTFEIMVRHANRQLQKISDRYLLVRDSSQPLELNVIDNYQASEIRSTKNLSGGESFIVSLALALGLSHMASQNVRIDSLFLDEGFGTLDEDALESALEALSGLHSAGKVIGIISHVPALRERISTQIKVSPRTGGRSIISGPGCHGPA